MAQQNTKTPVMVLQELTVKKGFAPPDYNIVFQISGTHENRFDFVVSVAGIQAKGSGSSKQISKHQAAHNALMKLQEMGIYNPSENPVAAFKVSLTDENSSYKAALNCIVDLQNICLEHKMPPPEFTEISSVGPAHNKEFTFECKISSITTEAKASTKKMAKQLAAKEMLSRVKQVLPDLELEQNDLNNSLMEKDAEALSRYQDLREIIPDKTVKVEDIPNTIAKLMLEKNLKYEDFKEDLLIHSEESLKKILDRLEVGFHLQTFQDFPPMAILVLKIDTPFTVLAIGKTYEEARAKVVTQTFVVMNRYMRIKL